jgi:hypothetical protein
LQPSDGQCAFVATDMIKLQYPKGFYSVTKIAQVETKQNTLVAEHSADKLTKSAQDALKPGADVVGESVKRAISTAEIAAEDQYETARRSAADTTEIGQMFVELINQQTRHAMDTAAVFGRAVNWMDIAEAQRNFIVGSFARISQINASYREFLLSGMTSVSRL